MASILGVARGGTVEVDDGQAPLGGGSEPLADQQFVVAAQLGDGGGFASPGLAGDDQPTAAGDLVTVEQDQAAAGGEHLADGRGGDHDQAGVVVQAGLVVGGSSLGGQGLQLPGWDQVWRDGCVVDKAPPAVLGDQRGVVPVLVVLGAAVYHSGLSSCTGLKTPKGTTGLSWSPSGVSSGWSAAGAWLGGMAGRCAAWTWTPTRVRARICAEPAGGGPVLPARRNT
jgi:hypothetical protein